MDHRHVHENVAGRTTSSAAGSLSLGRVFGVDVFVHWSWLLGFALLTWLLATRHLADTYTGWTAGQRWSAAAIAVSLILVTMALHELAHALEGRRRGLRVTEISVTVLGGPPFAQLQDRRPRDEFWIAVAGPLATFAAAAVWTSLWLVGRAADIELLRAIAGYLAWISVALGLVALLPIFPLDGALIARSLLRAAGRGTPDAVRVVGVLGQSIVFLLFAAGMIAAVSGNFAAGVWLIVIAWFLGQAAHRSFQQHLVEARLRGLPVGVLADLNTPHVSPTLTLDQFEQFLVAEGKRAAFVASDAGQILGFISVRDLGRFPADAWSGTSVYRAMTPSEQVVSVPPEMDALHALQLMAARGVHHLPMRSGRELVGLLSDTALLSAVSGRPDPHHSTSPGGGLPHQIRRQ
jgi:Zn-dependent protease/CBS domain-containing protein